ncbi:MAG: hypothetical protein HWE22_03780 [Flavobacteriales bacterium]|nr:hypothetical protein [Flavobacteriales bacterium]
MKDWCKYNFGYVNFDDSFVYFTSTGNWSDTKKLEELNDPSATKSSSEERFKSISYLSLLAVLVICILWFAGFQSLSWAAIIGIGWAAYSAYHYFAPGISGEFKIPYSKINSLLISSNEVHINFSDYHGENSVHICTRIDAKGLRLFSEISKQYNLDEKETNYDELDISNVHS